ncbi:CAMK family protein kinase [Trichomonas vaginalis G3]|uniref:CAMK family protein kinase n=1 Tax=Trichomonas vaginalis (strain ATCC PRA-98 / G3) TaxID=412133 RepID=A2G1W7_TRIV3|nr:protein kinase protein [Trichomonas vaginalis G3]EAX88846.1 CAMK family protein kinase [Trichomonas vaginalis G3]KAI5515532.1 protein kinase protein [Trichomonas vaginalis G3]|eukprot:XP_001301776.1 CAMK family protein kinase [Trichomonas vaginalis G3]
MIKTSLFEKHEYTIMERIGKGGFSCCYKVLSQKYNDYFVGKIIEIDGDYMKLQKINSYYDEIKSLMNLDHPNIIKIYDTFHDENYFVVILEYCSGGDLDNFIRTNKSLRPSLQISIVDQMITSLAFCHSREIAHHDIKPSNFFFDQYARLKLADFGISQINECLQTKNYCGSFVYAAPELLAKTPYNPYKADIWSLGITIMQFVTLTLPKADESKDQYFSRMHEQMKEMDNEIPSCIKHIIKRCLVSNPDERADICELYEYIKPFNVHQQKKSHRSSAILANICTWKNFTRTLSSSFDPIH